MKNNLTEEAASLAARWLVRANEMLTREEKQRQRQLTRVLADPAGIVTLAQLIDRSFRPRDPGRVADQVTHILETRGVPSFFEPLEKLLLTLFAGAGRHLPAVSVPRFIAAMRQASSHLVIPAEEEALGEFLQACRREGVRVNINHIGEEVLGEAEAARQLKAYVDDLRNPAIEYVSVKISTLYSQLTPLAFDHCTAVLSERLATLYRTAAQHDYITSGGRRIPKFVNLDMEASRDLDMTAAAFMAALDRPEFTSFFAGMALQAYLPDSFTLLKKITAWAQRRVNSGGSPVKIRIVKGANMAMERLESAVSNWPLAPYGEKADTDANFKRMLQFALKPENASAVRLGVASHNLFDLAYAHLLAHRSGTEGHFSFEMLSGMADHLRRALQEQTGQEVVVYAPVADSSRFTSAIAYLVRRLDENTGPRNFLRHAGGLEPGTRVWKQLVRQFEISAARIGALAETPHRRQNRTGKETPVRTGTYYRNAFINEPNTDWSLAPNRCWAAAIRSKCRQAAPGVPQEIPLVVGGREIFAGRRKVDCFDPNQMPDRVRVASFALANASDADRAVATAKADPNGWRKKTLRQRHLVLSRVARELRRARSGLIGTAAATTGKVFEEADVEVSEAIDFAEYYPFAARRFDGIGQIRCRGRGVVLVISPWNFPIAIPCGGIVAALAAGNTVIFKPSSAAVPVAWTLCRYFWRAGVSTATLQFLPCAGSRTGTRLTEHPDVDAVILTGGTDTGMTILKHRPDVFLAAETGGKNATVVTAMADREQAIRHVITSAFSNSGQKCSATSLLILEDEVYRDPGFKRHLVDAARSLPTGSAWDFANRMGPLIHPPKGDLQRALTTLEPGESWALKPKPHHANPHLWTPGIKWDVSPGSATHMIEFFGPLLGVMHARNLDHAIELVNHTGYGLTSGLESLDAREQARWREGVRAGNLYINRGTTGAVTLRQPFGGMGKSALGAGIKAGGPEYVAQFMRFEEKGFPESGPLERPHPLLRLAGQWHRKLEGGGLANHAADIRKFIAAVSSYLYHFERHFGREIDYFHLPGQSNRLRYLPLGTVAVRLHPDDTLFDVLGRIAAVRITGNRLRISSPPDLINPVTAFLGSGNGRRLTDDSQIVREDDEGLISAIGNLNRIRYAAPHRVPQAVAAAAAATGYYIARDPVLMEGRIELLHYLHQQSISDDYHRYGNLGDRDLSRAFHNT